MIAIAPVPGSNRTADWQASFLELLPSIERHARHAFRHLRPEAQEDAITEAIAAATVAYARLHELGKQDLAYPAVLAQYAARQVRSGRQVGGQMNSRDVLSRVAQRRRGFSVAHFHDVPSEQPSWEQAVLHDTRSASPADVAAFRLDFRNWLVGLPKRLREIALALAAGDRTGEVARQFGLSDGRVSQLRRALHDAWLAFQGEALLPGERCAA